MHSGKFMPGAKKASVAELEQLITSAFAISALHQPLPFIILNPREMIYFLKL
jgi:hypothetical protein